MSRRYPHFTEEWKSVVQQAKYQRFFAAIMLPLAIGYLSYLGRPTHEFVFAGLLVAVIALLSEIQIDIRGMSMIMAQDQEARRAAVEPDFDLS
jgi:ABC-type multidrug transport system fused ATPase/permease subunit